ncbi:WPP domain-interacting tail-anchored protein 1 [Senna tora]|uniref:RING-type E3 ubiquitin transferase n=1 Tax=Senna tora TaxID=362788 RepID=A0A834SGZ0_9FABA|nr:WPP domain-interacting tail-anchored protein 1 [Senna tora]
MDPESSENEAYATSVGDVNDNFDEESDKVVLYGGESSDGEVIGECGIDSTTITGLEVGLAGFSEKITNLRIFMMRLAATMESEFEALGSEEDRMGLESIEKGLEFDLLSGILDSEVRELDKFLYTLQNEIADARERVSSCTHMGESFMEMKAKLFDFEQLLKQSEEQFSVIAMQSANFQKNLSSFKREENGKGEVGKIVQEDDQSLNMNAEINMQTAEQQRNILRMLEKSMAREMDLEKNMNDSIQIEEELSLRISSLEQELVHTVEEATDVWERWLEADSACQILIGVSRDILGRLQISHFNLNGLMQRESELRAKLVLANSEASTLTEKVNSLEKQLKESEFQLLNTKVSADEYQKQYNVLCSDVRDMENLIVKLKENVSNAESRANSAETENKLLAESNTKLNQELALLKDGGDATKRVDLLESQLKESDLRLQHAVASAEASQEKQSMLYSTIEDMENVIKDLKSNVSKAESRADNSEEKWIALSESNVELNEEISFLRNRLECLEESLHQVEEEKVATAKDIGLHIMNFKTLVTQLAVERERLNKKVSSLAFENKILVVKLEQTNKAPSQGTNDFNRDNGSSARDIKEEVCTTPVPGHKVDKTWENLPADDYEMKPADFVPDSGTVRRVDVGVLNFKHFLIAILVLLVSATTYLFLNDVNSDSFSNSLSHSTMAHRFSTFQLPVLFSPEDEFDESDPDEQVSDIPSLAPHDHFCSNPFATVSFDHLSNHSNWYSDSDSDSASCFVTDLFENRSSENSCRRCDDSSDINPFSGVLSDGHGGEGSSYAEIEDEGVSAVREIPGSERVRSHTDGLRVVGFSSDSDSNVDDELDRAIEFSSGENDGNRISDFDDLDARLCWDNLRLEDQRTLNENFEWEELEEGVNDGEDLSVVIGEVDDQSVASGFSYAEEPGEEALRYLEWEILLAVNNLERISSLEHDANVSSLITIRDDVYMYTADYDLFFGRFLENESSFKGSPPTAKSFMENLPVVELTMEDLQGENVACAVCKDEILLKEKVTRLPCSHFYHGDCIRPWLSIRNTCPVCRFELPTDDPDYEQRKNQGTAHDQLEFAV